MVNELGVDYGWSSEPDESNELYDVIPLRPFCHGGIRVTLQPGSRSFKFECERTNDSCYGCADPSGCYRVGNNIGIGGNYYCNTHFDPDDVTHPGTNSKLILEEKMVAMEYCVKKANQVKQLASMEFGVRNGSAEEIALGQRMQAQAFLQWQNFINAVVNAPHTMVFKSYSFTIKDGLLRYQTGSKKPVAICLYPLCGKKSGKSLSQATVVCSDADHQRFKGHLINMLPPQQRKFASGK